MQPTDDDISLLKQIHASGSEVEIGGNADDHGAYRRLESLGWLQSRRRMVALTSVYSLTLDGACLAGLACVTTPA